MTDTFPVTWFTEGTPRPQGSKTLTRGRLVEQSKYVHAWRSKIKLEAIHACRSEPSASQMNVRLKFYFKCPKSHYTTNGQLSSTRSEWHTQKPDIDKLIRAVLDALTGVLWVDDSQVVGVVATKHWHKEKEGVLIDVDEAETVTW